MNFEKVKLFFERTTSSVKDKILILFDKVKDSEFLKDLKERIRNLLVSTKEKTSNSLQKILGSAAYVNFKRFCFSVPQRAKSLFNTVRQFLIDVFFKIKHSRFIKSVTSSIKLSVLPVCIELKQDIKSFFDNIFLFVRTNIISKPLIFIPVLFIINILLIAFILQQTLFAEYYWEGKDEKKFTVTPGKTLNEVVEELNEQGIIQSQFIFKFLAKLTGNEGNIIARHYIFKNGMSNLELLELLTDINIKQTVRFTVIEGLTIRDIGKIVEKRFFLSSERFIKETESDSLINILGLKDSINNLEGFLFPDTYIVPLNINERYLVETMFDEFLKRILNNDEIKSRILQEEKSILKVITLASIVQAETPIEEEKPVVSGVYHNRLQKRMRLEADPTVQYILPNGPKKRLLYSDLKIESPYNTYLNFGLPPGPINNPGFSAIKAALNPEKHDYLFFVANGKGGHKFSETYGEHLRAVQEYRNNRRNQNNHNNSQ